MSEELMNKQTADNTLSDEELAKVSGGTYADQEYFDIMINGEMVTMRNPFNPNPEDVVKPSTL